MVGNHELDDTNSVLNYYSSPQFYYPGANVVQMRFLRLHSSTAVQTVTFSCHPGHRLGQTHRDIKFLTDTKKQSYLGEIRDCMVKTKSLNFPLQLHSSKP